MDEELTENAFTKSLGKVFHTTKVFVKLSYKCHLRCIKSLLLSTSDMIIVYCTWANVREFERCGSHDLLLPLVSFCGIV